MNERAAAFAQKAASAAIAIAASASIAAGPALAAKGFEPVNNPQLLPKDFQPVVDVAGFLTPGQVERLSKEVTSLEKATGIKVRVLSQAYPNAPGIAIKDYWGVDDDTVVLVADPGTGNVLNFSVGGAVDLEVPQSFWSRLSGKYGTKNFVEKNGQDYAIETAVSAIDSCLREESGKLKCQKIQSEFGEEPSSGQIGGKMGKMFK